MDKEKVIDDNTMANIAELENIIRDLDYGDITLNSLVFRLRDIINGLEGK
ncbi:hypothetical protein LCGC14_1740330 [marine sediment metagenome]|uniref:Uncharacterized protein n=1 Tax=marine sediment metagenome TaxID=412755 RepID=A0A0F9JM50_9ZZZZ